MNHTDQMRFRKGGGALMLFGLPFFLMSLFFMVMGLRGEMKTESGNVASPLLVILFSIPFLSVGIFLIFGRAGVEIDRRSGNVVRWWGLLFFPLRSKRHDLSSFTHVRLHRRVTRSKNGTSITFPFALAGAAVEAECENPRDYTTGRARAEALAKFTRLDLHDEADGDTIVHKAEHLDETVAQRVRRLGLPVAWPQAPASSRIRCDHDGETAVIRLPPPGFPWGHALVLIPAFAFIAFVTILFLIPFLAEDGMSDMPVPGYLVFGGTFAIFVLGPLSAVLLPLLRAIVHELTLAASGQGIHIESRGPFSRKRWTFPADELEELALANRSIHAGEERFGRELKSPDGAGAPKGPKNFVLALATSAAGRNPGLRLRSDRQFCVIGSHLTDDELLWLHDALQYILVHSRPA